MFGKSVRAAVALVVLCVGSGFAAPQGVAAPPAHGVSWSKCFAAQGPFECATVQVPLDYEQQEGTTSIALARLPATDPAHRIGSLFLNPGGPGGSGVDLVVQFGPLLFTPEVRARFDLVGFDPRGIARSTALRCFGSEKQLAPAFAPFAFPITAEEEQIWAAADLDVVDACGQRGGRIQDHMSTANVARDLDMLRQAVGDAKLNYYGISYGSFLGQTYANMFPANFRALVIDGVVDPIACVNTGGAIPFSTRIRSDAGAMATLNEFFRLCDLGGDRCGAGPKSAQRYADTLQKLLTDGPVDITFPDGSTFHATYANLIGATLGALYESLEWEDFSGGLGFVEGKVLGPAFRVRAAPRAALSAWHPEFIAKRGFPHYFNAEGGPAVFCSDSDNPDSYSAWHDAAVASAAQFGYFGPDWTWISSICAKWGGADADRYTGPFNRATAAPVLVVGNLFDPATRYEGAVTAHNLLANSALLTVHGWGHTSAFLSQCADLAIARYLIDVAVPAPGTVCEQDHVPFSG